MPKTQEEINEMEVVAPEMVTSCNALRLCVPKPLFDMIEECELCGRCL